MIPTFRRDGRLPVGTHMASWQEVEERFGQTPHRGRLLAGLLRAMRLLRLAGCGTIYLDGSFVTAKAEPGDFDACWDIQGIQADLVAPIFFDFADGRAAQKEQFGGEFFPAQLPEGGTGKNWLDFFQQDREGQPKGIVVIDLGSIP